MSFNDNARIDTSQVESGGSGGGPGGMVVGGGIFGLIITLILMFFGIDPGQLPQDPTGGTNQGQVQPGGTQNGAAFDECKTGADANKSDECRVIATVNSVQDYWSKELPKYGKEYVPANTVLYNGATQSACGTASNQVGPFYCPVDGKVYIDASFFKQLTTRFGADDGALAQEYVVAHEYGHHLQNVLGLLGRAQQDPAGPQSGAVRVELMADCLGGVWAKNAVNTKDEQGNALMKPLTEADIKSALSAAAAVGDDNIQKKAQGRVTPENWTHGSSEARMNWFLTGYKSGNLNSCDTFAVDRVS
ncbi:KPN_02809 family neutral zinc metallopeptidase [Actinomycetota bacterium]